MWSSATSPPDIRHGVQRCLSARFAHVPSTPCLISRCPAELAHWTHCTAPSTLLDTVKRERGGARGANWPSASCAGGETAARWRLREELGAGASPPGNAHALHTVPSTASCYSVHDASLFREGVYRGEGVPRRRCVRLGRADCAEMYLRARLKRARPPRVCRLPASHSEACLCGTPCPFPHLDVCMSACMYQ